MLCYRDVTFCPYYTECLDGETCPRRLTPEVHAAADLVGLPICTYLEKPDCFRKDAAP